MNHIYLALKKHINNALNDAFPKASEDARKQGYLFDPQLVSATKPEFGDFQINGALALAKSIKEPPRQIAEKIINQLNKNKDFQSLCLPPKIAGPGFINLTIQNHCLINEMVSQIKDDRLGVPIAGDDASLQSESIIVDFSSPNIAKEMHVGHLRSTIIGDSIARILNFRGHKVLRLNHVGDWGTQFGMLITHLKSVAPETLTKANVIDLGDLVDFYRQAKKRFDEDESFQSSSRQEVVKLQQGDDGSLKAWGLLCSQSRHEFQKIYDRLDIELCERGESFYNPFLKAVVDDLKELGLLVQDAGAQCVFLDGIVGKDGKPLPIIIQKSDGGYNYATTDLAAIRYRLKSSPTGGDGANRVIYVTDSGQANHFAAVFQVAQRAQWVPHGSRLEHVPFGLVQGEDGKKLKTRSGDTVRLKDLLDEAVERAKADLEKRLLEEGRKESQEFIEQVSNTIGIAAVKYADLSQNRTTNYQFSFDRMLSLQGNTAPYLLYAIVRIAGINRKGGDFDSLVRQFEFHEDQEWALIRMLLKFDEIILEVETELLPNRLCSYLFELSQTFNRFYDQIPVLKAQEPSKSCRLMLCRLTGDILKKGLNLLGISTLERM